MKKIVSIILFFVMVLSMSCIVFAENNNVVITYTNGASYEINIPSSTSISSKTGKGAITVTITHANLATGSNISVTATSNNYSNGSWYLINERDKTSKLPYSIGTTDGGNDISSGDIVLYSNGVSFSTLYITLNDRSKAGDFTDTITFVSGIVVE